MNTSLRFQQDGKEFTIRDIIEYRSDKNELLVLAEATYETGHRDVPIDSIQDPFGIIPQQIQRGLLDRRDLGYVVQSETHPEPVGVYTTLKSAQEVAERVVRLATKTFGSNRKACTVSFEKTSPKQWHVVANIAIPTTTISETYVYTPSRLKS